MLSESGETDKENCKAENQTSIGFDCGDVGPSSSTDLSWSSWIKFDSKEAVFCCLWLDCQAEIDIGNSKREACFLQDHLNDHIGDYLVQNNFCKDQRYPCLIKGCEFIAPIFGHLRRHMSMHRHHAELMLKGAKVYHSSPDLQDPLIKRGECGFSCKMHIEYAGQELVCQLNNCGASYEDVGEFFNHVHRDIDFLESKDLKDRNCDSYICKWDDCNTKCGNTKWLFRRHVASAHLFEKVIACPFCGAFFHVTPKFIEHLKRRVDESSKNYACCVCHKKFFDEDLLADHIVLHIGVKKCLICGAFLGQATDMQKHVLTHSLRDKTYSCDQCDKAFYDERQLHVHSLTHKEPGFTCLDCGRQFRTTFQFNRHKREHVQKPVYACHVCAMTYDTGSKLSRHFKSSHYLPIPDGFSRFSYHACDDGVYRLQTRRLIREENGPKNLTYANNV